MSRSFFRNFHSHFFLFCQYTQHILSCRISITHIGELINYNQLLRYPQIGCHSSGKLKVSDVIMVTINTLVVKNEGACNMYESSIQMTFFMLYSIAPVRSIIHSTCHSHQKVEHHVNHAGQCARYQIPQFHYRNGRKPDDEKYILSFCHPKSH